MAACFKQTGGGKGKLASPQVLWWMNYRGNELLQPGQVRQLLSCWRNFTPLTKQLVSSREQMDFSHMESLMFSSGVAAVYKEVMITQEALPSCHYAKQLLRRTQPDERNTATATLETC